MRQTYLEHLVIEGVEQTAEELLGVLLAALLRGGEGARGPQHAQPRAALQRRPARHRQRGRPRAAPPARAPAAAAARQRAELVAQLHPAPGVKCHKLIIIILKRTTIKNRTKKNAIKLIK